jgi:malate dehydrogenase
VRRKITVVGESKGATIALLLAERDYGEVVLYNDAPGVAQRAALDLNYAAPALGCEPRVVGTDSWYDTAGSEIVVVANDVQGDDAEQRLINIAREISRRSPDAVVVVGVGGIAPSALMQATLFPRQRVIGIAPTVVSTALRAALAAELLASARDITALVLGGDGPDLVPALSAATVAGTPVRDMLTGERLAAIVADVCAGGAPALGDTVAAAAVRAVVDAIMQDRGQVLACAVLCSGEYGLGRAFLGVPVRIGAAGVEEVVELPLSEEECELLRAAAAAAGPVPAIAPATS